MRIRHALMALSLTAAAAVQGAPITYYANLTGAAEAPPNSSTASGKAEITFDPVAHTLRVYVVFAGLSGPNSAAHIHCCTASANAGTAGVATATPTFPGFGALGTGGTYDQTFDTLLTSTYRGAFIPAGGVSAAEALLFQGILNGQAYLNIHSNAYPGGEIRGFLSPVPEPATMALAGVSLGLLAWRRNRRIY